MEILGFQTIDSKPALHHPKLDLIVISDIHLGLEASMSSKGGYVPRFQLEELTEEIKEMKQEVEAEKILVNGDLKNQFSTSYQEKNEIDKFLKFLKTQFQEIIIVEGNHDTHLKNTAKKHGLELKEKYIHEKIMFTHGHKPIKMQEKEIETIIIGHEHPALSITDEIGVKEKVPCFLHGKLNQELNIIVMPAYSKIANGSEINKMPANELLSPILREKGIRNLKATAISREAGIFEFPEVSKIN
jgi:putative SbcD/Mre11-related phosphoesterase